ncbi:MAG: hypothetical protein A3F31_04135 [Candidatus Levybacteria bacterium RIFCSPHIGHO2_12_FULL_38_12]|nr:MAG: hypothetical protein A3F31_04135 [Candidatus Levybacteria bacterium RIFCSPHIGHO2_12_FULL_38_12]OGH34386.1 MAG: hypothetical protein A3A47_04530 [Candidatus Levybacteria bacterium RIFCSPLOWO2_01_FULL_37_20]OGH44429.1 MAG: hypothetical protein A3J14_03180 [Candidatus Levybacteria bacterium RIFCSPLOWO2_02_FULL_37_18]
MKCFLCKKGIQVGRSHTHHPGVAGQRWKKRAPHTRKVFKPNLHVAHTLINGARNKVKLCTKCLRKYKQSIKPKVQISSEQPAIASISA